MQLLTEAYLIVASNGSFGINTDILETNLVNQIILLVGLFFVGKDFLSESLSQRQEEIVQGVEDSEKRLREAQDRLSPFVDEANIIDSDSKLAMNATGDFENAIDLIKKNLEIHSK